MRTGFLACKYEYSLIDGICRSYAFCPENLMHSSLVFPQVVNTFEYFLANMTSLRILSRVLHTDMTRQVGFPHTLVTVRTGRHQSAYNEKPSIGIRLADICT